MDICRCRRIATNRPATAAGQDRRASAEILASLGLTLYNTIVDFDETVAFDAEISFCPMTLAK